MKLSVKKHYILFALLTIAYAALVIRMSRYFYVENGVFWRRLEVFTLIYIFAGMHCFIDVRTIYDWIYKHRILVTLGLFIFAVANCFTGSSVSMYDSYIQPGATSQFSKPIFGTARAVRSDEWMEILSRMMAGSYNHYGATNDIVRGTVTSGISATGGLYFDYSALRTPSSWGYYLFGASYGNSFSWSFKIIFGFLLTFELFMILTKKNKLYSLFGAVLIWFSTYNMWWSISTIMMSAIAVVVFFYYMIKQSDWKWRLLFGAMLAISVADFATDLYPAWQVPFGWVIVSLFIWILIDNDNWKHYKWYDWLVIAVDVLFLCSIILRYLQVNAQYLQDVMSTVYPGKRYSYGEFQLLKLFKYPTSVVTPFFDVENGSEAGTFFAGFPLGIVLSIIVLKKSKFKNWLIWCLLIPAVMLLCYCTIGLPPFIAKIFMMTSSTAGRAVDILGFISSLLLVISLSELETYERIGFVKGGIIAALCIMPSVLFNEALPKSLLILFVIVVCIVITFIISEKKEKIRKGILLVSGLLIFVDGIRVIPVTVGLSAITSKPLYSEVQSIVNNSSERTLWISTGDTANSCFLIASGAPTLNSTNYVPNKDMWHVLDPNNENEQIWNRYAHVSMKLSNQEESSMTLLYADSIAVDLSVKDFKALEISYVLTSDPIPEKYSDVLELIYDEYGIQIYHIINND